MVYILLKVANFLNNTKTKTINFCPKIKSPTFRGYPEHPDKEIIDEPILHPRKENLNIKETISHSDKENLNIEETTSVAGNNNVENSTVRDQRLSADWPIKNYNCLTLSKKLASGKLRPFIQCNVCKEYEDVARKFSKNHSMPIADGIRVDDQHKLRKVIEHLEGEPHRHAVLAKEKHEQWKARSDSHELQKYLNSQEDYLI